MTSLYLRRAPRACPPHGCLAITFWARVTRSWGFVSGALQEHLRRVSSKGCCRTKYRRNGVKPLIDVQYRTIGES